MSFNQFSSFKFLIRIKCGAKVLLFFDICKFLGILFHFSATLTAQSLVINDPTTVQLREITLIYGY